MNGKVVWSIFSTILLTNIVFPLTDIYTNTNYSGVHELFFLFMFFALTMLTNLTNQLQTDPRSRFSYSTT